MIDLVFPEKNEQEFIDIAERLGYKSLVLCYKQKPIPDLKKFNAKIKLFTGLLADCKKIQAARKDADIVIVHSSEDDRTCLEQFKPDLLFHMETLRPKDFIHQRASGLNHILSGLAVKNEVLIGFNFSTILRAEGQERAKLIGRIKQNIKLCRKYKVSMAIASFARDPFEMRSHHDLSALFENFGMHPLEARNSLNSIHEKINENLKRKSSYYAGKYVEVVG